MTPIEKAALPIARMLGCGLTIKGQFELCTHADADDEARRPVGECGCVQAVRAALLALEKCDFKGPHLLPDEAFKARLRAIASEGGEK